MGTPIGKILLMSKGDYSGSAVYNSLDWVRDNGKAWVCKVDGTTGITPAEGANWTLLAADGNVSGNVEWTHVNNKPFATVDTTDDFKVDANAEMTIKRGTFGTVRVVSDNSGSPTTTDLEASGDAIIKLKGGTNVTLSADDSANPKEITINSSGGGSGGHEMIPTTNDISTVALLDDGDDDYVVNAYTVQRYSNVECMTIFTTAAQGTDTIGSWNDTWETDGDRQNWLWHSALYHILADDTVEASMVFDVIDNETVSVYAYRVDDEVFQPVTSPSGNPKAQGWYESDGQTPPTYTETNDTTVQSGKTYYMAGGAIAIKLNSKIQTAGGVKIGLNLKRQRTLVENFSVIS